jgi:hypothetical protein
MIYQIYNSSGVILRTVCCPEVDAENQLQIGESYVEGYGRDDLNYIKDGKIAERPEMDITVDKTSVTANETDKVVIDKLPEGTKAVIQNQEHTITDNKLELTFSDAGTYTIKLSCWPYLDKEITINATDSGLTAKD